MFKMVQRQNKGLFGFVKRWLLCWVNTSVVDLTY